jgi:hypothetical protein
MADVELEQVLGAIPSAIAFINRPIAGDTFLYVATQKPDHWTYERSELSAGLLTLNGESGRAVDGDEAHDWI